MPEAVIIKNVEKYVGYDEFDIELIDINYYYATFEINFSRYDIENTTKELRENYIIN